MQMREPLCGRIKKNAWMIFLRGGREAVAMLLALLGVVGWSAGWRNCWRKAN